MAKDEQWFCDLGIGIDTSQVTPTIIICRKPAKLYKFDGVFSEVALCEEHKNWKAMIASSRHEDK